MTETPQLPDRRHHVTFRQDPDKGRRAEIIVDGVDIARHVSGIQIVSDTVQGTRVALEVPPQRLGEVCFEGIARVQIDEYANDPGPAAVEFLSAMDAAEVEKLALNRLDLDNEAAGTTRAIIRTLIDLASGKVPE
jgi:hypothetical protein